MVKKVIDIFPPQALPADDNELLEQESPQKEPEVAKPKITFVSRPKPGAKKEAVGRSSFGSIAAKIAIAAAVVAGLMIAASWKYARAVITIWPETSELARQTKIVVDTSVKTADFNKKIIPGVTVSAEKTVVSENQATGKKTVQSKAQGTVKIFNNYTLPQRLVKGTRLQAPLEKFQPSLAKDETPWFRTAEDVVLEPKSSATVNVIADAAGEKYNIAPSVFSVPGLVGTAQYTFIYAQSFEKFQGGSVGDASLATQDDLDKTKAAVLSAANTELEKELHKSVPQGYVLIKETAKYSFEEPVVSAASGTQTDKVSGQIKAKAVGTAYSKKDLDELAKTYINGQVPAQSLIYEKSLTINSSYSGQDQESGRPSLELKVSASIYPQIDEAELKKGLLEKSREQAQMFLGAMKGDTADLKLKDAKIVLDPPWQFSIPRDFDRVQIKTIIE